ncbi:MAG: hypothetical protein JWO44_2500 [Bacteroidetes bacterium]|nr:hypothetical protein [Bacteroidota bacterium]
MMVAGISLSAQTLSNAGFESWGVTSTYSSDTLPNQWWSLYCNTTHQSTDSYQGAYATRIQGYFSCGIAQGIMINGQPPAGYYNIIESGTPFSTKPAGISGFYKYTDAEPADSAEVTVILKKYNTATQMRDTVGLGTAALAAAGGYTSFTVNINYLMPAETPDSIIIMFNSSKYNLVNTTTWMLPNLYIDRIMLPQSVAVAGITENQAGLFQTTVYPNPFSGSATVSIEGDLSKVSGLQLDVFDAAGKKVWTGEVNQNTVILSGISSGNYMYTLGTKDKQFSGGKIIVQ